MSIKQQNEINELSEQVRVLSKRVDALTATLTELQGKKKRGR